MSYEWNWTWVQNNWPTLFRGLLVTFQLTLWAVVGGIVAGTLLGLMRRARLWPVRWLAFAIIELFRDLPVLVLMVWMFYCMPILMGANMSIPPFWVAVIALGLNFAALEAEIIRSGIEAIPAGEIEAARGLNFTGGQILLHIVLPQSFWRSLPPTLGQGITTLKLTALASFIAVEELFFVTTSLIQKTLRPLEFYTVMAGLYLLLIVPLALILQGFEKRLSKRFRHDD